MRITEETRGSKLTFQGNVLGALMRIKEARNDLTQHAQQPSTVRSSCRGHGLFQERHFLSLSSFLQDLFVFACIRDACYACGGQKGTLSTLELKFKAVVGCHMGVGNQTQALCKSSRCF